MHNAALPGRIGEELGRALGKAHTGIGYDQPNAVEAAFLEMCEECAPASLVLLGAFTDAENLPITLIVHTDRDKQGDVADLAGPAALPSSNAISKVTPSIAFLSAAPLSRSPSDK
jgi:hypothetical protein